MAGVTPKRPVEPASNTTLRAAPVPVVDDEKII
jgi:hypothetical protein